MSKSNKILVRAALLSLAFSQQFALAQNHVGRENPAIGVRKDVNHYDRTDRVTEFRRIHWGKQYDNKGTGVVSRIGVEIHIKPDQPPLGFLFVNTNDSDIRGFRETTYGYPDFRTKYTGVVRSNDSPYKFSFKNGKPKTGTLFSGTRLNVKEIRGGFENECCEYLFAGQLRIVEDNFYQLASTMADGDRLEIRLAGTKSVPSIDLSADHIEDLVYMIKKSRQWLESNKPEFVANAYDEEDERHEKTNEAERRMNVARAVLNSATREYQSFLALDKYSRKSQDEFDEMMRPSDGRSLPRIEWNTDQDEPGGDRSRLPEPSAVPSPMVAKLRARMEQARVSFEKAKQEYEKLANSLQRSGSDKPKSPEEAGVWKCSAGDFMPIYQLNDNGTFLAYFEKNGPENPILQGDWVRDGANVTFKALGKTSKAKYEENKFRLNGFEYDRQQ